MGDVTALNMDAITDKSGHQIVPNAVSVCLTPAAPSPLPIPYPVICQVGEGITDPPMRTKINGALIGTTGAVLKACHGNEAGTLKEVVSLNTGGPVFIIVGAPNIICELGMMGFTGSLCISNKAVTVGAGATASGAGGDAGGAGAGAGGSGGGDGSDGPSATNGGGDGGGGTNTGASASPEDPPDRYCPDKNKKAPDDTMVDGSAQRIDGKNTSEHIEDMDLRNHQDAIISHGNKGGRKAARFAMFGQPGGNATDENGEITKHQAFWSGGDEAIQTVRNDKKHDDGKGFTIQEDSGGAGGLDKMGKDGELGPKDDRTMWQNTELHGKDSKITNERLWKTISRRSAQNAEGKVDAFVIGKAHTGNVFSTVELPTLLHNDKVDEITFHEPFPSNPPKGPVKWKRNPKDGCWEGPPVPAGDKPAPPGKPEWQVHGFSLCKTGINRTR